MSNEIKDPKFFEGGKAIFTVHNDKGIHYTYKISKKPKWPFCIYVLTGPDNNSNYTYLGVYNPNNFRVYLTGKSKYKDDTMMVKVIRWAVARIGSGKPVPEGYGIKHDGRCCRCGRRLTTPESVDSGIGPECRKRMG